MRLHNFFGDDFVVEYPTDSGKYCNLAEASMDGMQRMVNLFLPDPQTGKRPCHGDVKFLSLIHI